MDKLIKCPLCGLTDQEEFYHGIDKYYSGKNVRFVACGNCSLIFFKSKTG